MAKAESLSLKRFQANFGTNEACASYILSKRWKEGYSCPRCKHREYYLVQTRALLECKQCSYQISVTSGTIMHNKRGKSALYEQTNKIVGFITAISDGVLSAYIPLLEVLPSYQRQGIGGKLVQLMLQELSDIYMVDLICDEHLQNFYERIGLFKAKGMITRNFAFQAGRLNYYENLAAGTL